MCRSTQSARWRRAALCRSRDESACEPREPSGEHERRVRPGAARAGEELEVGARVRLHRAADVLAEHHEPPARHAAASPERTASRPVRRLPRSAARRCASRGGSSRAGGGVAEWPARGSSSAGRAGPAPAARARRSSSSRAAPDRSRAAAGRRPPDRPRHPAEPADEGRPRSSSPGCGFSWVSVSGTAFGLSSASSGSNGSSSIWLPRTPKKNTASKAFTCEWSASMAAVSRVEQKPAPGDRIDERERLCEVGRARGRDRQPRLAQVAVRWNAPTSGGRTRWIVSDAGSGSFAAHEPRRGGRCESPPGSSSVSSGPRQRAGDGPGSSV